MCRLRRARLGAFGLGALRAGFASSGCAVVSRRTCGSAGPVARRRRAVVMRRGAGRGRRHRGPVLAEIVRGGDHRGVRSTAADAGCFRCPRSGRSASARPSTPSWVSRRQAGPGRGRNRRRRGRSPRRRRAERPAAAPSPESPAYPPITSSTGLTAGRHPGAAQPLCCLPRHSRRAQPNHYVLLLSLADGADGRSAYHRGAARLSAQASGGRSAEPGRPSLLWALPGLASLCAVEPPRRPEPARVSSRPRTAHRLEVRVAAGP